MRFSVASVRAVLEAHTPADATAWVVAISGGVDSACLLTAVAALRKLPVRAVHVDHALQPANAEFRAACATLCDGLQVPLSVVDVTVRTDGVSIEAAARDARYAGIARQLRAGECLLTAHHATDQAETVLLQLLRGAGLKGLSAMPRCRRFGAGWHLRPLLEVAKQDLLEFAAAERIPAVSDPMNLDERFERTYLRRRVWPLLQERWPGAATALSRTARHIADAQDLLDHSASIAVEKLRDGDALSVTGLRALSAAAQRNAVRFWIASRGIEGPAAAAPSTARLSEALRQFIEADADRLPAVVWGDRALRRYRERLYLTPAHPARLDSPLAWTVAEQARLDLGVGLGTLRWLPQLGGLDAARLPRTLTVRRREGGELLRPHGRSRTQTVQHLCQSRGVLPWMRDALPFVHAGTALISVGDLWQDARWCVAPGAPGFGIAWEHAPIIV